MAGLLVSVRSASEARAAWLGGATVIDVKEPDRGPLGCSDATVWRAVRDAVPLKTPVSVALGELGEWRDREPPSAATFAGVAFRKLGLAGSGANGANLWREAVADWGGTVPWVAVIYADWEIAHAPHPDSVVDAAASAHAAGVLIDTWSKRHRSPVDASWLDRIRRIRSSVGFVALAGGLDENAIRRLQPLAPDLFAVRGSACDRGDRRGVVNGDRVANLVAAARDAAPSFAG